MTTPLPWYKQFWPWFLIILPTCVVIASLATLKIAIDHQDSLVAEEYYKKGKAINQDLGKNQQAKELGMKFLLETNNNLLEFTQHAGPRYRAALNVELYHPTQAHKDLKFMATSDASGVFRIKLKDKIEGSWDVRIESYNHQWRLHKRLQLADQRQYWLN